MDELFNLKWNSFAINVSSSFSKIREADNLLDVTLVCDDGELEAHKLVLFSGSKFFQEVLQKSKHAHPLLYLKNMKIRSLKQIVDFIYYGEVNVTEKDLESFINIAADLKINGIKDLDDFSGSSKLRMLQKENLERIDDDISFVDPGQVQTSITEDCEQGQVSQEEFVKFLDEKVGKVGQEENSKSKNEVEIKYETKNDIEAEALSLMNKDFDDDGHISWSCEICKLSNNDKTKIRKHVQRKHLANKTNLSTTFETPSDDTHSLFSNNDDDKSLQLVISDNVAEKVPSLLDMKKLSGRNYWSCKVCGKESYNYQKLKLHVESKHGLEQFYDVGANNADNKEFGSNLSIDKENKRKYNTQLAQNDMVRKVTEPSGKHTWSCSVCGKNSYDKTRIRKHVEVHIEGLSYDCPYCIGKKLSSKNSLDQHLYRAHSKKD